MTKPPVPPLTALSEEQQAQAQNRFAMIRPALEDGVTQAQIARTHEIPASTIQRWVKRYRESGLAGLAGRSDKMTEQHEGTSQGFVATKAYRRFAEMCDGCRRTHVVGLGYGPPGTGKTEAAEQYAQWHLFKPFVPVPLITFTGRSAVDGLYPYRPLTFSPAPLDIPIQHCRTVFSTPPVSASASRIEKEVLTLFAVFSYLVEAANQLHQGTEEFLVTRRFSRHIELLIVDEANRLKDAGLEVMSVTYTLEQRGRLLNNRHYVYSELDSDISFQKSRARVYIMRDFADRGGFGLVLLGMPGLEKRLMHAPQRYSRVGFAHEMEPLSDDETRDFLEKRWNHRIKPSSDDFTEKEAVAAILRMTRGNSRVIERLMMQVEHVRVAHQTQIVTKDVVETTQQNLIIGPGWAVLSQIKVSHNRSVLATGEGESLTLSLWLMACLFGRNACGSHDNTDSCRLDLSFLCPRG